MAYIGSRGQQILHLFVLKSEKWGYCPLRPKSGVTCTPRITENYAYMLTTLTFTCYVSFARNIFVNMMKKVKVKVHKVQKNKDAVVLQ